MCDFVIGRGREDVFTDILCENRENAVVVLEERAGGINKLEIVNVFGGICIWVRDAGLAVDSLVSLIFDDSVRILFGGSIVLGLWDPFGAFSEENGGTTFVCTEVVGHAFSLPPVPSTDSFCANGAVFNIYGESCTFFHEADWGHFFENTSDTVTAVTPPGIWRTIKMWGKFCAVAIL